jgi:CheY-like chemotaxis protein
MARILLIDDDVNLLQMVKLMLTRVGHEVQTADSGEDGLQIAAQTRPDLAIIDVMMPGLNGYDVVRKMREDSRTTRIPVIILTARSQPMDKHMALEAGANAFLSKPVTAQELAERVDAVLKAGVDYRVHTGLLTEPAHRPLSPAPPVKELTADSERPTSPRPPERRPIGVDDTDSSAEPIPPAARLPVVAVTSLRGGTGSTTVAVNLAFLLASRGRRVCLVDLSTTSGHIPLHLHLQPQQHWGQLLATGDAPDPRAITQLLSTHAQSGVAVLSAPPLPSSKSLSTAAIQSILGELSSGYNHVVVDVPNFDPAAQGALLMSRSVIVVMSDDPPAVQTTGQYLIALQNLGIELGRVRVVLNHVRPTGDVPAETIQKALKRPLSTTLPYDANHIQALRRGVPLVVSAPNSAYAQAIQQLTRTMTL